MEVDGTSRQGTSSGNGDALIAIEELVKSIREKLDKLSCPSTKCCIYKVPKKFKKINEEAYTPLRVSIGPHHHGKEGLEDMEEHKLRYFNDFMKRSGKSLEELVKIMKDMEKGIRDCYAETINLKSAIFLEIILVDAAFIVEFLLRYRFPWLKAPNDRIFRKPWMIDDVRYDLLLLENQLPLFVLLDLSERTNINLGFSRNETMSYSFIRLSLNWLEEGNIIQELPVLKDINPSKVKHFLDLLRSCLIPMKDSHASVPEEKSPSKVKQIFDCLIGHLIPRQSLQQTERKFGIPSATELHEAGVKFKVSSSKNIFDIKFSGNILEIPQTEIVDATERLLRNIIAYEQCHCDVKFFADYTAFMNYLINTSKDVELLVRAKIIDNWLGDNNDVSNLFNGLGKEVNIYSNAYYFTELHKQLNDYCEIPSHKWKATLRQDYCNTPWRVLSIIVAVILLGFTFIQSLCSLVSCNKLEQESGFFFNMKYFEDEVHNGNWDEVEKYLSSFTKVDDNRYSMKIFFEIRK
ncbi:UPF0481 protein [Camellia lanceoleosa]|uniref:UPF0481 protein n=1 Tax=Camellia lanceoleosa TaxID=1840588 RepID=A0ACC0G0P7_9ERIC|nr:UPF0481 protein [Camellia lanceoleosa]